YISSRNNEKCNLSLLSDKTDMLRASKGSGQVRGFLDRLNKTKCKGKIDFLGQLRKYKRFMRSKSRIVIISDFLYDIKEIKESLYLYKGHDLKVIMVLDESETAFKVFGSLILEDSETGQKMETYINESKRQEYREKLYEHISNIENEVTHAGGKFFLFSTDVPLFEAFYKVLR
ncbi:MAG: hypothetical protein NDI94_07090, partial [Candidatus Woesearchaeota archaeon]|nr:hypothetical protein [Candidatus Woesearchaeota archaeon]